MKEKSHKKVGAPRKARRLRSSIARDIGALILSGRYQPGELLIGEVEASLRLQVSRTTYREAMCTLAAKGLVEMRRRTGTRVTAIDQWHWFDPDLLAWSAEIECEHQFTGRLAELLKSIEPGVAALAAERRTAAQLIEMRRALTRMEARTGDEGAALLPERQFRAALFQSSQNVYMIALGRTIDTVVDPRMQGRMVDALPPKAAMKLYADLFDAVAAGNPVGARQAMSALIDVASGREAEMSAREKQLNDEKTTCARR